MVEQGYVDEGERRQFEVEFRHNHLPRMEEVGVAIYNEERDKISMVPDENLDKLLGTIEELEE
jgi:hypothetical protein